MKKSVFQKENFKKKVMLEKKKIQMFMCVLECLCASSVQLFYGGVSVILSTSCMFVSADLLKCAWTHSGP